jgi:hypothetical protein
VLDHAVSLFFSLRRQTPEIGNISETTRRIQPAPALIGGNTEHWRSVLARKGRVWWPLLARRTIFSEIKNLWLATQSISSASNFPVTGKNTGKFAEKRPPDALHPCNEPEKSTLPIEIPCASEQGISEEETGKAISRAGNLSLIPTPKDKLPLRSFANLMIGSSGGSSVILTESAPTLRERADSRSRGARDERSRGNAGACR